MSKWVLIDASYLAYRAFHSMGHLSLEDVPTGVLFGFLSQFRQVCEDPRVNSTKAVLFFDTPSWDGYRARAYPPYKKKRRKSNEDEEQAEKISTMKVQLNLLRDQILPEIGLQCLHQDGLESDDLIAYAAKRVHSAMGSKGIIITSDGDLYQCINRLCDWYDPGRDKYYTKQSFRKLKGISPFKWRDVKCIAGCISDNVAGVPGVGEKSAIQYLRGELPSKYKKHQAIVSKEGMKIRKRNRKLVVLPHKKTLPFELEEPDYDADAFFECCERYGFASFLRNRTGWLRFFRGNRTRKRGERRG